MEKNNMKISVLSGKGGTGKTLVSVNLAAAASESVYIDCDVEEPNGHLFFKPNKIISERIMVHIPVVDENKCNGCRACIDFCKFNALAYINNKLAIFDEICHSCGGCILFCPERALFEKTKMVGQVEYGTSKAVTVITGRLNIGEASGIPIIKKLLHHANKGNKITFIDSPPGSACTVMESIKDVDYCILVAEPTLFGVHNLTMVYDLVKLFHKPYGVILNKCVDEENPAEKFCREKNIKILGEIPFDHELGMMNSNALIAVRTSETYKRLFTSLLQTVIEEVQHETIVNP
jgi:MinD superfamily P-loop ATPase